MNPTAELIQPEVLELIREGAYSELRAALRGIPAADVAEVIGSLEPEQAAVCFRFLPRDDAGEVFSYLNADFQEELIDKLGDSALRVIEGMDADDRVRLLDELPPEVAQRIIARLSPEERRTTQAILGYPPGSVGRLMTPDYVRLKPDWTIAHALEHIRKHGRDAETLNVVYVTDDAGVLIDDLRIRVILLADPQSTVESIMERRFVALRAHEPQEEAVRMMARYDRSALPVIDSRGVLIGIVTADDVADVAEEEATEDIQKIGGVQALEEPYIDMPILGLVRKRAPWLGLLYMSELLTTTALGYFEDEIARAAILATFIPAIISSGGNSGSQASTLVVRAMALREIELRDWFRVFRRELLCGVILGVMIGAMAFIRINLWGALGLFRPDSPERHYFTILAVTITATLIGVVTWGSIIGGMLPFILRRLKFDPATSSNPFVATLVDVTGILIYFTCAIMILSNTILATRADAAYQFQTPEQRYLIFVNDQGKPIQVAPADAPDSRFDIADFVPAPASDTPAGP
ncbi:MAG: magnesium transporter [Phycisphaeraceae bacterium]|nr:magnesium transporter [Phycisphaeraceae bacterium]